LYDFGTYDYHFFEELKRVVYFKAGDYTMYGTSVRYRFSWMSSLPLSLVPGKYTAGLKDTLQYCTTA
jgi:hypothetical protein